MKTEKIIDLGKFEIGNSLPLTLILGPCQIESSAHAFECADYLNTMANKLGVNFIFKSSFDKANRMSIAGQRGIGLEKSLSIFTEIKSRYGCPVLTDVHTEEQCRIIGDVVDIIQTPALLCRQTDLLLAAGRTGKIVNVKKGQFMAPWDMAKVAEKVASTGNDNIMLTERGVTFGYNRLINDMRALPIMAETGYPIVFDATHSIQEPGGLGSASGGQRQFVKTVARAAVAIGVAALFIETHPNPDNAPSDGPCMVPFQDLKNLLKEIMAFDQLAKAV
jgi:2-dehydro-3-deoxyphosphooctonate aldolase (KDO 8-P synthase)